MPRSANTISNTSTFAGWLESTGLDDIFLNPCSCFWWEDPPPPPLPGERRRNHQIQRQPTVEEENPVCTVFSIAQLFGGKTRTRSRVTVEDPVIRPVAAPGSFAFWKQRSMTFLEFYSDESESPDKYGLINFSLEYDFSSQTLVLKIIQGRDLAAMDRNGLSDPYVRVTLLPDKKQRLETRIKRRTLNPKWNETFYFEGFPLSKLQNRILHLHVYDYDRFSRDDSIGEVYLPLSKIELTSKPNYWLPLKPQFKEKLGEILVSLIYLPSTNMLTLGVLKARNLKAKDINGLSDPYIKIWLYFGEKRVEKKKTPVYKCNLNPTFNQTFEFEVPWEQIRDCSLEVFVMDFDTVGRNELIGKIRLGARNNSGEMEKKHWSEMMAKPRQAAVIWHRLKPGD